MFRLLTVQGGPVHVDMRFNFEKCYNFYRAGVQLALAICVYFSFSCVKPISTFYYIYNHTVVHYYAKEMVLEFMIWEGEAIMNDLNYKESSYNFEFPYEDDESKRILYNSRTNALALIDKENCETLCAANCETLCAANCSLCGARSCVGKMVPEPYGG